MVSVQHGAQLSSGEGGVKDGHDDLRIGKSCSSCQIRIQQLVLPHRESRAFMSHVKNPSSDICHPVPEPCVSHQLNL